MISRFNVGELRRCGRKTSPYSQGFPSYPSSSSSKEERKTHRETATTKAEKKERPRKERAMWAKRETLMNSHSNSVHIWAEKRATKRETTRGNGGNTGTAANPEGAAPVGMRPRVWGQMDSKLRCSKSSNSHAKTMIHNILNGASTAVRGLRTVVCARVPKSARTSLKETVLKTAFNIRAAISMNSLRNSCATARSCSDESKRKSRIGGSETAMGLPSFSACKFSSSAEILWNSKLCPN